MALTMRRPGSSTKSRRVVTMTATTITRASLPDTPNSKSSDSVTPTTPSRKGTSSASNPLDPMSSLSTEEQVALVVRTIADYNEMRLAAIVSEKSRLHACCGCGKRCGKGPDGKKISMRPDLAAGMKFRAAGKCVNTGSKVVGVVPGVTVGQRFECRYDMVVVGLMTQHMAGIDVQHAATGEKSFVTAIVHSGTYEDNNLEKLADGEMIYTGQGGNNYLHDKKQVSSQQLRGPNAALANNIELELPVRVIVKVPDATSWSKNTFIFDGLWDVKRFWSEPGKSGFEVFKYLLVRRADQSISVRLESRAEIAAKRAQQKEAQRQLKTEQKEVQKQLKTEEKEVQKQLRIKEKEVRKQQRQEELQMKPRGIKRRNQERDVVGDEELLQEKMQIDAACAKVLRGIDFVSLFQKSQLCDIATPEDIHVVN